VDTLYLRGLTSAGAEAAAQRALKGAPVSDHFKVSLRTVEDSVNGGSMLAATFIHPRIQAPAGKLNDHGTGCSLASAIAAGLAGGLRPHPHAFGGGGPAARLGAAPAGEELAVLLVGAALEGIQFVTRAMRAATTVTIGQGHGPLLHHFGDCGA
jgi:hydroxymethylpyrimidine/phosphomethylpyrimidine kinase